jgi:hypothetical protein
MITRTVSMVTMITTIMTTMVMARITIIITATRTNWM